MSIRIALLGLLVLAAGCSQLVQHKPQALERDPVEVVRQVLKEQPGDYAPVEMAIHNDRFEVKRNRQVPVTVYFSSVSDILIYKKGREYRLGVIDKSGANRLWVVTHREDQAHLFASAMKELASP